MMPILMIMYVGQMLIMKSAYPDHPIGNYAIMCAVTIATYVATLFYYDKNIVTLIDREFITTHTIYGKEIVIDIQDITQIIAPEKDCKFSTIVICCDKKVIPLRFIDNPIEIKNLILALQNEDRRKTAA